MPPASLYPAIPVINRMIVLPSSLFAEARDKFFLKVVDAQIEFRRDSTGAVTGLTLFQNGNALPGTRIRE